MNAIKQLFGQTAIYGLGIVLPRVLNYILLTPFYTRIFNPEEYGIVTELYAYVVFLLVVLTYGMETGFFRFANQEKSDTRNIYKTILSTIIITSLLFVLIVGLFRFRIAEFIDYKNYEYLISWLSVIVAIDAFTAIPFAYIRIENKPVKYAFVRLAEVIVNISLNVFFLYYCPKNLDHSLIQKIYNPELGVGYVLLSNLVASVIKLVLLSKEILVGLKGVFSFKLLRKILKYTLPLLIAGLAGTVNEAIDRVLIKHLISVEDNPMYQLGIYGANYKIAVLMTLYIQMFKYAAEPFFFSKSGEKKAKKLYADTLIFFLIPGIFVFLLVTMYLDLFKLFIGTNFREGLSIVPIILLANLVMGIFFNMSIWYKLTNLTKYGAILVIIGALITVFINYIFVPEYGYIASAWAHLIAYSVMVILSYLFSLKHYRINYDLKRIALYLIIAMVIFTVNNQFLGDNSVLNNVVKGIILSGFVILAVRMEYNRFTAYNQT